VEAEHTIHVAFMAVGAIAGGAGVLFGIFAAAKSSKGAAVTGGILLAFGGIFFVVGLRTGGESQPEPTPIDGLVAMWKEWTVVDPLKLQSGPPSLARGRKVAIMFRGGIDGSLHEQHPDPIAATRAEVGVVILIDRDVDATAMTYPGGAHGYGATFHCAAIATPENVVVAKWDRYVPPSKATPRAHTGGHWHTADSGTTVIQGLSSDQELLDATQVAAGTVPVGSARP
jgi:hypothetical protein